MALAQQIFYPEYFGGAWGFCPDPVDFHAFQLVNVYTDKNAYFDIGPFQKLPRPVGRLRNDHIFTTLEDFSRQETVLGTRGRSGGQMDAFHATFGPAGPDGYPAQLWNPETGEINPEVARYWREHFDLTATLQRDWERLGPRLVGKLHITMGTKDTFYLDAAVIPRLAIWFGAMLALFAAVAAWPAAPAERRRLAALGLSGLIVCGATSAASVAIHRELDPAHGWSYLLAVAAIVAALGWGWTARRPDGPGLTVVAAATAAALVAGAIVREAPRLALIERARPTAAHAGGVVVFAVTLAVGIAAIIWVIRTVRNPAGTGYSGAPRGPS